MNPDRVLGKGMPNWCWKYLETCPPSGAGIHRWLSGAALRLLKYVGRDEAFELLNLAARGGRANAAQRREIQDVLWWAEQRLGQMPALYDEELHYYLEANLQAIQQNGADGPGVQIFTDQLPAIEAEEAIDQLFPKDSLLCVAGDPREPITAPREELRGWLAKLQYIVPSPMSAVTGFTQTGDASEHCLENTGVRRFLVTEFDLGQDTLDIQANLICHLNELGLPLTMVVWSGSKSLHAWWYVQGMSEAATEGTSLFHFFRYATYLGADRHLWLKSQFVRIPGGWNFKTLQRQPIYYFDPRTII